MMYQSQQNFIMFITVLGRHVSVLIEIISRPFWDTEFQLLNIEDKSLKVCQEYDINIGKLSVTKRDINAWFF